MSTTETSGNGDQRRDGRESRHEVRDRRHPRLDVDRAKAFYESLGWRLDVDLGNDDFRIVQFTPPGSGCSIQFGIGLTKAAPGSAQGLLVVSDIESAHEELAQRRVYGSEVFHDATGGYNRFNPDKERLAPIRNGGRNVPFAPNSAIRTETPGNCRRSRTGYPAVSTRRRPRSAPSRMWPARFDVRRPPTASTRPGRARRTRTGPTGTPRTWWRSRRAPSSRR